MVRILVGDCRHRLDELKDDSIHCVITSPPYFGLRDYGVGGQLGLEDTIEQYVSNLLDVFRKVRRTLHPTGTLILNLGDSYARQAGCNSTRGKPNTGQAKPERMETEPRGINKPPQGLKAKDLAGVPFRVVMALQADGWWWRQTMPWLKANAMPESVTDRPTTAHEYVFLLAKSARYFWDGEAIRKAYAAHTLRSADIMEQSILKSDGMDNKIRKKPELGKDWKFSITSSGRNYRTTDPWFASLDERIEQQRAYLAHLEHVRAEGGLLLDEDGDPLALNVTTAGFSGAHFAVFPPDLVLPFVRAGTSERGVCGECGWPWERVVERETVRQIARRKGRDPTLPPKYAARGVYDGKTAGCYVAGNQQKTPNITTLGWRPTCSCSASDPIPATILDPFGGAGTVGLVADREQRDAILCELSREYAEMSRDRIKSDGGMFTDVRLE